MKTLHFDCFAGISGDMALGAFVDLGLDPALLREELGKLKLEGWHLDFFRDERNGICGTHAVVDLGGSGEHLAEEAETGGGRGAGDSCHHHHGPGGHRHHGEGGGHDHPCGHRSWKDIRRLIEDAPLSPGAKERAVDMFSRIAQAESEVHGLPLEEVAFHEVGALDSIIDIVGAAVSLELLKPDRITCGEVELGGGTVNCAHGVLPVPAPATLILCRGMPVRTGGFSREMTTPTGAAILASAVDEFVTASRFREIKTGCGIGTRKLDKPNILRVSWREEEGTGPAPWIVEELVLMETNIDDMSGEALGFLMERLFDAGALDVTFTPTVMKKSRPGTVVSVLCPPAKLNILRETMFKKSAAIGFREEPVRRLSLPRKTGELRGIHGAARQKTVFYGEEALRSKIEYEDRARLARERDISLEEAGELIAREGEG